MSKNVFAFSRDYFVLNVWWSFHLVQIFFDATRDKIIMGGGLHYKCFLFVCSYFAVSKYFFAFSRDYFVLNVWWSFHLVQIFFDATCDKIIMDGGLHYECFLFVCLFCCCLSCVCLCSYLTFCNCSFLCCYLFVCLLACCCCFSNASCFLAWQFLIKLFFSCSYFRSNWVVAASNLLLVVVSRRGPTDNSYCSRSP